MKILVTLLFLSCSFLSRSQGTEEPKVRNAFESYKSAILNDRATDALNSVDSNTRAYYTTLLRHVKKSDSVTISSLPLLDKLSILMLRAVASKEEILEMKGTDAFLYAIENGMVGKNSVMNVSIGKVQINADFATGEFIHDGKPTDISFHFRKERGAWRVDLTSIFQVSTGAFKNMIKESGKSEHIFLFEILEELADHPITSEIWHPLE